jgi:hypothetical protein
MTADAQATEAKPPYISYTTLTSFIDNKLADGPLPPRIDRGFLDSYAGTVQAQLLQTLRQMDLIHEDGTVKPLLQAAAKHPNERKVIFKAWAERFYAKQQELAEDTATAQMLWESFAWAKYQGSTLRKAVVFYLALVEDVGLKKSRYFKPPRQIVKSSAGADRNRKVDPPPPADQRPPHLQGEQKVVVLGDAGTVTVFVDVRWLDLPVDVFTKLRTVIGDLESLAIPAEPNSTDLPSEAPSQGDAAG